MRSVIDFERVLLGVLWLSWLIYWVAAAQRTAPNKRMETLLTGASYRIPLVIGIFLMVFSRIPLFPVNATFWARTPLLLRAGLALTVAGLSFAAWGPCSPWQILEWARHSQSESSCDTDWTLRLGPASHL